VVRALCAALACAVASSAPVACAPLGGSPAAAPSFAPVHRAGSARWLFVSDLHFDPFANPRLVDRLAAAPPRAWQRIIDADRAQPSAGIFHDTNAALLRSALAAMDAAAPQPRMVVIAGDFLAHHFRERYDAARTPGPRDAAGREAAYDAFVDATIAYLAVAFDRRFPRARFLVTIGNNDGYCGDYASTPESPSLAHLATAWQPLVDRGGAAPDFARSFPHLGAYVARLPLRSDVRALVVNSVYWSPAYGNVCARNDGRQAPAEFAWMARAARAGTSATRWWLLTHIPPGIDAFASLETQSVRTMYAPAALRGLRALRLSGGRGFALIVAGHTHASAFRVARGAGGPGVAPVTIVPAITPVNVDMLPALKDGDSAMHRSYDTKRFLLR